MHRGGIFLLAAWLLWTVVAVLFGWALGVFLFVPMRMIVFLVVASLGVVWLLGLHFMQYLMPTFSHAELPRLQPGETSSAQSVPEVLEEIMSQKEAREWLDEFLVKQQKV